MTIPQGRTRQIFVKEEASYGVEETLAATNAFRHISRGSFDHQPNNRVDSPEKNPTPGRFRRFDRKPATNLSGLNANVQPSGVLNTPPEGGPFFKAAFGTLTNVTLATTVASSPTVGGCTVASAGTLAVGDAVLLEVTGQAGPYVRKLTGVAGNVLTWDPDLPAAQTVGDDVKGTITYKLTTALATSLTLLDDLSAQQEEFIGLGIDSLVLAHDPNSEVLMTVGGPAKDLLGTAGAQATPGAFTSVGTQNPPSGVVDGYLMVDDAEYLFKTLNITLTNALQVRNTEYGVRLPTELNRNGVRTIDVGINTFAEVEATLKDKARAGTKVSILIQTGKTEGNIVAAYMPSVDFAYPSQDDGSGEVSWDFSGAALESTQGGNDELILVFA